MLVNMTKPGGKSDGSGFIGKQDHAAVKVKALAEHIDDRFQHPVNRVQGTDRIAHFAGQHRIVEVLLQLFHELITRCRQVLNNVCDFGHFGFGRLSVEDRISHDAERHSRKQRKRIKGKSRNIQ